MAEQIVGVVECERSPRLFHRCRDATGRGAIYGELTVRLAQRPGSIQIRCSECDLSLVLTRQRATAINQSLVDRAIIGSRLVVEIGDQRLIMSRVHVSVEEVQESWRNYFDNPRALATCPSSAVVQTTA